MTMEELANKKIQAAVEAFKVRVRDQTMALKPDPENDVKRRELVSQFHIADDVGKSIAAQLMRV